MPKRKNKVRIPFNSDKVWSEDGIKNGNLVMDDEDFEDLVCTMFEQNNWIYRKERDVVRGTFFESEINFPDGKFYIYPDYGELGPDPLFENINGPDCRDLEKECYVLTKPDVIRGLRLAIEAGWFPVEKIGREIKPDDYDLLIADAVLQFALFGKRIFC